MTYFPHPPETRSKPVPSESAASAPIRFPGGPPPSPIILVVDDNQALRELLTYALSGQGYEVLCAHDGEAGWEILLKEHVDLLITDNDMPRLSGLDLLRRMRAQSRMQPAILVSGDLPFSAPDFGKLLSPGVALEKPFSFEELYSKINELIPSANQAGEESVSSYSVASAAQQ